LLTTVILAIIASNKIGDAQKPVSDKEIMHRSQFENFITKHKRMYASPAEKEYRFQVFSKTLDEIAETNSKNLSYTAGINKFTDLTKEEFKAKYLGFKPDLNKKPVESVTEEQVAATPTSIDWRTQGAVTPVKDQGQCGSCWSFSATGALEAAYFFKTNTLLSFSEQELVDCSILQGNLGCNGGLPVRAFNYWKTKNFFLETDYPYTATNGVCKYKQVASKGKGTVPNYKENGPTESDLLVSVATMPTSIGVYAVPWQTYNSGIYGDLTACPSNPQMLDHAVLAVGYGTASDGTDYWIVKNSWSADWGEQGYIRLQRGLAPGGVCGCALDTSIVTEVSPAN
jgi:C1A family cysteine protease